MSALCLPRVPTSQSRLLLQSGRAVLPQLLILVLALALFLRLGLGAKQLMAPEDLPPESAAAANTIMQSSRVDLAAIRTMHMFESPAAASAPAQRQTLAQTVSPQEDLRLEGVILAGQAEQSVAFILSRGRQQGYRVGDTLLDGALILKEVARDHVILDRRGETLRLSLREQTSAQTSQAPAMQVSGLATAVPRFNQADLAGALQVVDEAMNLASLAEIITVTPAQQNGRLIGYRLNPGVRLKEFIQLGLRTGDIVTAVNGTPLDDPTALQSLPGLMIGRPEVSFSLLREGEVMNLRISLQELASTSQGSANSTDTMERP